MGKPTNYFLALLLASPLGACLAAETGSDGGVSSARGTVVGDGDVSVDGEGGGGGGVVVSGGSCPARAGAAACPAPPQGAPADLGSTWVGCEYTSCPTPSACTTCMCVADDAGAAWDCAEGGFKVEEGDAQPTAYCALNSGPVDSGDQADAGPIERCTPQYPTCSAPAPESPGWQCCRVATSGVITEIKCMPSSADAG
jgi:hypothetical protein